MTSEEMQKTMQFILEQQAQTALNIQRLEETQKNSEARIGRLEGAIVGVVNMIDRLARTQERMAEAQGKAEALWNAKFAELAETQKQTDERLNALINTVERYIGERRNGNPKND